MSARKAAAGSAARLFPDTTISPVIANDWNQRMRNLPPRESAAFPAKSSGQKDYRLRRILACNRIINFSRGHPIAGHNVPDSTIITPIANEVVGAFSPRRSVSWAISRDASRTYGGSGRSFDRPVHGSADDRSHAFRP